MFEQLSEFGAAYIVMMILVIVVFIMDTVAIIGVFTKHKDSLSDYAEFMLKYGKIVMLFLLGAFFILQTLDTKIITSVRILHIVIGIIAIIDSIVSLVIKLKFNYKGKK